MLYSVNGRRKKVKKTNNNSFQKVIRLDLLCCTLSLSPASTQLSRDRVHTKYNFSSLLIFEFLYLLLYVLHTPRHSRTFSHFQRIRPSRAATYVQSVSGPAHTDVYVRTRVRTKGSGSGRSWAGVCLGARGVPQLDSLCTFVHTLALARVKNAQH